MKKAQSVSTAVALAVLCSVAVTTYAQPQCSLRQLTSTPELTPGGEIAYINFMTFSKGGASVAISSNHDFVPGQNLDGNSEIFTLDIGTGQFRQVTDTIGSAHQFPALNGDGSLLAFSSREDLVPGSNPDGSIEIFLFDCQTAEFAQITDSLPGSGPSWISLSDDGLRLAFLWSGPLAGMNLDGSFEIFAYDVPSDTLLQITDSVEPSNLSGREIAISGDGSTVAFMWPRDEIPGGNPDGNNELFVFSIDDGQLTQITDTVSPLTGDGSTGSNFDASFIAFFSNADLTGENPSQMLLPYLFSSASGEFQTITTQAGVDGGGISLGAPGERIAFVASNDLVPGSNPNFSSEVFIWDSALAGLFQVADQSDPSMSYSIGSPQISGNGLAIAYLSTADYLPGQNEDHGREIFLATCGPTSTVDVPTLSLWGLVVMLSLLAFAGLYMLR